MKEKLSLRLKEAEIAKGRCVGEWKPEEVVRFIRQADPKIFQDVREVRLLFLFSWAATPQARLWLFKVSLQSFFIADYDGAKEEFWEFLRMCDRAQVNPWKVLSL